MQLNVILRIDKINNRFNNKKNNYETNFYNFCHGDNEFGNDGTNKSVDLGEWSIDVWYINRNN